MEITLTNENFEEEVLDNKILEKGRMSYGYSGNDYGGA